MFRIFIALITSAVVLPATAQDQCYSSELDLTTYQMFTEPDYKTTFQEWINFEPPFPGIITAFQAYHTYITERQTVETLTGDKRKHCYIGCRIAQSASYEAATYAAWHKEMQDLIDCDPNSVFDPQDFDFTVDGAKLGLTSSDKQFCYDTCAVIKRPAGQ